MDRFQDLWDEHVQFGTSRSHKKLCAQARTRNGPVRTEQQQQQRESWHSTMSGISKSKSSKAASPSSHGVGSRGAERQ